MTSVAPPLAAAELDPDLPRAVSEVLRRLPDVARSYLPGSGLPAARREALLAAGASRGGSHLAAWVHEEWGSCLGATADDLDDARSAVVVDDHRDAFLVDPEMVTLSVGDDAVGMAGAAVALGVLGSVVERAAVRLVAPLRSRLRPRNALAGLADLATVAAFSPLAVSGAALGAALHVANSVVPPLPQVGFVDDEPNLLAHLVAGALPEHLANPVVRGVVLRWPAAVGVGIRSGAQAATVRVGQGRVTVANGIAPDVVALVDGDARLISQAGWVRLDRELRGGRRPSR